MTVICVPDALADALGAASIEGVELVTWDMTSEPPANIADTRLFVPVYMGGDSSIRVHALSLMPRLEVIQLLSAGVDPWLPVLPAGVLLCNGRGIHGSSTAEMAVAGMLAQLRELPRFLDEQRAGHWSPERTGGLAGRRVLVLGVGDIGERVARVAEIFDAEVTRVGRQARDGVHNLDDLPTLIANQDVVVVALPLTDQTEGLLDAEFLAQLPDQALVVNIARGPIVVTDALLAELTAGRLRAFLDVTDPEPLPEGHPLWSAPNVLITPHVAGGTDGWMSRAADLVIAQVDRFVTGAELVNRVGPDY